MPRAERKKVESGVYHIVLRGINKQDIFFDDTDKKVFLNRIKLVKEKSKFELYAYCLMSNHVHLVVKELSVPLSKILSQILTSFVYWYNKKYERVGSLFQDRYKSEGIESDEHLLCAIRYIHRNPLKAGMVQNVADYSWSSYANYLSESGGIVNTGFAVDILGSQEQYLEFMARDEQLPFIEYENKIFLTDEKLQDEIKKLMVIKQIKSFSETNKDNRAIIDDLIILLKQQFPGVSLEQVSRVTGLPISIIRYIK